MREKKKQFSMCRNSRFRLNPRWLIYIVSFLSVFTIIFLFSFLIKEVSSVKLRIVIFAGDTFLLLSPYWLLPQSKQKSILIPVWLIPIFLMVNVWYFRYWNDLIPITSIFTWSSYNLLVAKSVASVISWKDILFVIVPGITTIIVARCRFTSDKIPRPYNWILFLGSLLVFVMAFLLSSYKMMKYWENHGEESNFATVSKNRFAMMSVRTQSWHSNGFVCYLLSQLASVDKCKRISRLSDEQQSLINNVLDHSALQSLPDSAFVANAHKNLILIIVESLNSPVIGRVVNGCSVTPVIDSLLSLSGTIAALNVKVQVKDGGSSDGQMIYNTGLLPVTNGPTALLYADTRFPSLVGILSPQSSAEIIYESKSIWNHAETSKSYGYEVIYDADSLDCRNNSAIGMDETVFNYALSRLPSMKQPFVVEITTLSMHSPFNDPAVTYPLWIDDAHGIGLLERNYLRMTHYFDCQLGRFLDGLKRNGLLENTVVVLASDHDQIFRKEEMQVRYPISFIAINTGKTVKMESEIQQCDVFPTILDIMDVCHSEYHGVGYSFLRSEYDSIKNNKSENDLYKASDLIIRSDFFSNSASH